MEVNRLALGVCFLLSISCSPITQEERRARRDTVIITPYDSTPMRIRFDLYRTPYSTEQDPKLPVYERIRLGMRRFAEEELRKKGLCEYGFNGPDIVLVPENDRDHAFFHVDCLPAP